MIPNPTPQDNPFLKAALDIGKCLEDLAIQTEDGISLVGVKLLKDNFGPPQPLGVDLYEGTPGVALFLAYLGQVTGQSQFTELAERALLTSLRQWDEAKGNLVSIGGFDGWGGAIYAATHLGCLWGRIDLLEKATEFAELVPALIPEDKCFDIIGGAAGCILGLLALYKTTGSSRALEIARECGDHLLSQAQPMEHGIGWAQEGLSSMPLTGFSHGNAGIAMALLQLWSSTNQERFRSAALNAITYERSLFSELVGNWPDLRNRKSAGLRGSDREQRFRIAWCHGASGIGFARLKCLEYLDDPEINEEVETALRTTLEGELGYNHSLCHGDLGNLDFILGAARALDKPLLSELAHQLSARVLDSAERYGWLCGAPIDAEMPGLMTGLSGIGYGMLRIASPLEVPSVLMMEPPRLPPSKSS